MVALFQRDSVVRIARSIRKPKIKYEINSTLQNLSASESMKDVIERIKSTEFNLEENQVLNEQL